MPACGRRGHQSPAHRCARGTGRRTAGAARVSRPRGYGRAGECACGGHRAKVFEQERQPCFSVRSEEHTSELQSLAYLVCRLLLEKKKKKHDTREELTSGS